MELDSRGASLTLIDLSAPAKESLAFAATEDGGACTRFELLPGPMLSYNRQQTPFKKLLCAAGREARQGLMNFAHRPMTSKHNFAQRRRSGRFGRAQAQPRDCGELACAAQLAPIRPSFLKLARNHFDT